MSRQRPLLWWPKRDHAGRHWIAENVSATACGMRGWQRDMPSTLGFFADLWLVGLRYAGLCFRLCLWHDVFTAVRSHASAGCSAFLHTLGVCPLACAMLQWLKARLLRCELGGTGPLHPLPSGKHSTGSQHMHASVFQLGCLLHPGKLHHAHSRLVAHLRAPVVWRCLLIWLHSAGMISPGGEDWLQTSWSGDAQPFDSALPASSVRTIPCAKHWAWYHARVVLHQVPQKVQMPCDRDCHAMRPHF